MGPRRMRQSGAFEQRIIRGSAVGATVIGLSMALASCATAPTRTAHTSAANPTTLSAYAPIQTEPFPVPAANLRKIDPKYYRQEVPTPIEVSAEPGTIVVDPSNRFLYLVEAGGKSMRYGIGVGRQGFSWTGDATIKVKQEWPKWFPPPEMVERDPKAAPYAKGMDGGLDNPLGARALYLYQGNKDTLYRLHGTNEPASIGHAVSSGCIRLLNQDIIDLYNRVPLETKVIVLGGPETLPPASDGALYPPVAVGPLSPAQPI